MSEFSPRAVAGIGSATAALVLLMGIVTAEVEYPVARHYSSRQEISDLGATRPPHAVVTQPSATIFDLTMLVAGVLLLVVAWGLWRTYRHRPLLFVSAAFGLCTGLVGVFPGNTSPHPWIALGAFVTSSATALVASRVLPGPFRWVSLAVGVLAAAALVVGLSGSSSPVARELGLGGVERWIVYPLVLWLAALGGHLLAPRPTVPDHTVDQHTPTTSATDAR